MIELKNINKTYRTGQVSLKALQDVTLKIERGDFVAIMGPSGSGKSTLLHLLGFLDKPDDGSYTFMGQEINKLNDDQLAALRNHAAGFVFQLFYLLPRLNALENTELPLVYAGKRHLKELAAEKIKEVNLSPRAEHLPNQLSGGEQQRVAIARSLVNEPSILFADEPTGNLDTKSEKDILNIIKKLNDQGLTVVMVTHEKEIAGCAKRIIKMLDGRIISDERTKPLGKIPAGQKKISMEELLSTEKQQQRQATFKDHFRQAVHAIFSNKMRSFLSMLGILIGVAAVIAMLSIAQGAKDSIAKRLQSLGSNLLMVRPGARRMHGVTMEAGSVTRFTNEDAKAIAGLYSVKRVCPMVSGRGQLVHENRNWNTRVEGTGEDYAQMRAAVPEIGRFFTAGEVRSRQKVAVIGATVARELFDGADPLGSAIKINRINFRVIGILPEKGASGWRDRDDTVVIPFTTAMYRLLGKDYLDSIDVEVADAKLMEETEDAIKALVIKRHRLGKDAESSFQVRNMAEIQEMIAGTMSTLTWLLGSIAVISLLVGGIGVMNVMLVSVTERIREIGIRKAIGARSKDILTQFLIEAVVMTFSGGMLGIIFGFLISLIFAIFAGWAMRVTVGAVFLATTFTIAVGIGFGFWPAKKAAALDPIEALRYE